MPADRFCDMDCYRQAEQQILFAQELGLDKTAVLEVEGLVFYLLKQASALPFSKLN